MFDRTLPADFERRCLKLGTNEFGSWTARRVARPLALRITRVLLPLGVTADAMTVTALFLAAAATMSFACGTSAGRLCGAVLLELWYVADHVDGQLARYRGTSSLDGTALDYLMHHLVNSCLPLGLAYGLAQALGTDAWLAVGLVWSAALLSCGLRHDVRYKAFVQRLKLVYGKLEVTGGGGGRPTVEAWPRGLRATIAWCAAKLCEVHVLAHLFLGAALGEIFFPQLTPVILPASTALPAIVAVVVAFTRIVRERRRGEAESQFKQWFCVPTDASLEFRDGRWYVEPLLSATETPSSATPSSEPAVRSS